MAITPLALTHTINFLVLLAFVYGKPNRKTAIPVLLIGLVNCINMFLL